MTSRTCGWCGAVADMKPLHEKGLKVRLPQEDGNFVTAAYQCASSTCGRLSIAWCEHDDQSGFSPYAYYNAVEMIDVLDDVQWTPGKDFGVPYPDVPSHIAEAASEAHRCLSVGANRAAVLLARGVIEASAKDKGITSGNLWAKINALADQGFIRPFVKEQAHEVRVLGNDMAHGDFIAPVRDEDAEEVIGLMREILDEIFQAPARLDRVKAKRLAREAASSTE